MKDPSEDTLHGQLDTSFTTTQRDLYTSGLVASIGSHAFSVWGAIKHHSDYSSGVSWPSIVSPKAGAPTAMPEFCSAGRGAPRSLRRPLGAMRVLASPKTAFDQSATRNHGPHRAGLAESRALLPQRITLIKVPSSGRTSYS